MTKIALFEPEIAGNVGTVIRGCACFGADLHIIEPCGFPFDLRRIRQSALDYIDHVKITRHNSFASFHDEEIKKKKARLILATTKGKQPYNEFNFKQNDVILFGKESAGVPELVADMANDKIIIPMKNNMRSLNIAISCGIILSHLFSR